MYRPKYTIIVSNKKYQIPNMNFYDWDSVEAKSKELCKQGIKHIIRDNEFNVKVRMG